MLRRATGNEVLLYEDRVETLGPSGSSNHVIASTPEKWISIPIGGPVINRGDKLRVYLEPDGADTLDDSDSVISIPFTNIKTGQIKKVVDANMTFPSADQTVAAGQRVLWCYYEFEEDGFRFGAPNPYAGKIFLSVEDDT